MLATYKLHLFAFIVMTQLTNSTTCNSKPYVI